MSDSFERPSWDEYFMLQAELAKLRSNCITRHVGAVIVRNHRQIATGYNGTPPGVKNCFEHRDYQVNLANQAKSENCLVVLPTGLGKTAVALQVIADYLSKGTGGVLFLAPTRVLANQHYEFLKNNLTIEDITLITGEDLITKRKKLWMNSVICAIPV